MGRLPRIVLCLALFMAPYHSARAEPPSVAALRERAGAGDARAQVELGKVLAAGEAVPKDDVEAARLYRLAAQKGHAEGQYLFSFALRQGRGVVRDVEQAEEWLVKSAQGGYAPAAHYVGFRHEKGIDRPRDLGLAVKYYRIAAEQGNAHSQYSLGMLILEGKGAKKDLAEALRWLRLAADAGFDLALSQLGSMYLSGDGVPKDLREATRLLRLALEKRREEAEQGDPAGQWLLGIQLEAGSGLLLDPVEAAQWFRRSAEQGYVAGQWSLGVMYWEGRGVPRDGVRAYYWLSLAASTGYEPAKRRLDVVERLLSRAEIALAQAQARRFVARPERREAQPATETAREQRQPRGTATGFLVSEDGYIVTCEHVVSGASRIEVVTPGGALAAVVAVVDAANDIAVLKVTGKFKPLPIAPSRTVRLGATVATVGFPNPQLQGYVPKLAKGEIAGIAGPGDDPRYFQVSVPIQPGNSGGALFDEMGNVVGVVAARLSEEAALSTSGTRAENVNYAVKSTHVLGLLDALPLTTSALRAPGTTPLKFEDAVRAAEESTVLILVY